MREHSERRVRRSLSVCWLLLSALYLVPAAAAAGLSGTGAKYLERLNNALLRARSARVRTVVDSSYAPSRGSRRTNHVESEIAWAPGDRLMASDSGRAGHQLLVATGRWIYLYYPAQKRCVRMSLSQIATARSMVKGHLQMVLSGGPLVWTYSGRRLVRGRWCNLVTGKGTDGMMQSIYLDRASSVPLRMRVVQSSARGLATTSVEFPRFELNRPVDTRLFRFTPPRGVTVVKPGQRTASRPGCAHRAFPVAQSSLINCLASAS